MATSGSYDWSLDRDTLILRSLQLINVYGKLDTTVDSTDNNIAVDILNGMLKTWSIDGIKVPKRRVGYVFTAKDTAEYKLGSISGSTHCTNSYVSTTLSAAEASGQTILSITDTTGMTAADNIGIELDDGTRQWTTIASVDSSTQVTVDAALTGAAASGNTVVSYTTRLNRPLTILYGMSVDLNTGSESQIEIYGHDEYRQLPVKTTAGTPNNAYYDKLITGARPHYSSMFLFPRPNNVDKIVSIVYTDSIQDLDGSTDDIDLPQEWLHPVMFNLGVELAYQYGKFEEIERIQAKADKYYELLKGASYDDEDITISLRRR